jgi:hypothetical protein
MEHNTGEREAVTDREGCFSFANLGATDEYKFYTKMKSTGELGAMTLVQVTTPARTKRRPGRGRTEACAHDHREVARAGG